MNRTELLSLAERLEIPNDPMRFARDGVNAAALLRKLAELRPVAWHREHDFTLTTDAAYARALRRDGATMRALYQLSEVLTDE